MYDQDTRGMTTNRHRSLVGLGRGRRKAFVIDKGLAYKNVSGKPISGIETNFLST